MRAKYPGSGQQSSFVNIYNYLQSIFLSKYCVHAFAIVVDIIKQAKEFWEWRNDWIIWTGFYMIRTSVMKELILKTSNSLKTLSVQNI